MGQLVGSGKREVGKRLSQVIGEDGDWLGPGCWQRDNENWVDSGF